MHKIYTMNTAKRRKMHVYKVIIIGAGVAGLGAAKFLHENGFDNFLILEAQDKIGGRIKTIEFGQSETGLNEKIDGKPIVELGAQWIHGEDNSFFKLVKSAGFLHDKTSWEGEGDFLTSSGEKIEDRKVDQVVDWVDEQLENIESHSTESKSNHLSRESVGSYLRKNFVKFLVENCDINSSQDLRLKHALFQWTQNFQRIDNSCNQMSDLSLHRWAEFEDNPGEKYNNFLGGAQKMIDVTSKEFLTVGNLKLCSPVKKIKWETNEIRVVTAENKIFLCDTVIVTCSIGVLQAVKSQLFQPNLPLNISSAVDWTGFGSVTKLYLEWSTPWWPKDCKGFQFLWPDEFINCCDHDYEQDADDSCQHKLKHSWFKSITGFDPVLDNPNVLLAWVGGPEAVFLETLDENIVKSKCTELLKSFTRLEVPAPKAVLVSKWNSNPYFRGAYSFRSTKGDQILGDICAVLKLPVFHKDDHSKPAILFAGEALHKTHYSTLHGAFSSGIEQATLFLDLHKKNMEEISAGRSTSPSPTIREPENNHIHITISSKPDVEAKNN